MDADLFDAVSGTVAYKESTWTAPGDRLVTHELEGTEFNLGMSVCYDVRFPELYISLAKKGYCWTAIVL